MARSANAARHVTLFPTDEIGAELQLELAIIDRDTIDDLLAYAAGPEREQFALSALRIGVLALRQARGRVDADLIQRETQRMLSGLEGHLANHAAEMQTKLAGSLKDYFDPESGRFHERVQQLVREGGELEQLMRRQIAGEDSQLAKTLLTHVGQESPLLKMLDPNESAGLLRSLSLEVESQLATQRRHVLGEFSLDNKEGALSRMVRELTANHGQVAEALQKKLDTVVAEFSLDKDGSALSRLVKNVESAQKTITQEFSLDCEASALSRLRGELFAMLEKQIKDNSCFQEEVKVALGKMMARREEADRSTQHGMMFEESVLAFLEYRATHAGDALARTGQTTGFIKNCKKGDFVVELGPDSAACGAKIVVEAKEEAGYTLAKARVELETARKNRDAQVGLFVFSRKAAPADLDEVTRFGNDVFVVWDAEQPVSDVYFKVGLTLAKALSIRVEKLSQSQHEDYEAITTAILEIEKQSSMLGEVSTSAETIKKGAEGILERVRKTRNSLERQVETLQTTMNDLKLLAGEAGEAT